MRNMLQKTYKHGVNKKKKKVLFDDPPDEVNVNASQEVDT